MKVGERGIALIKEFESCRLKAYPYPATGGDPWTIGYGHTGPEVVPGLVISQQEADDYLAQDLARFEQCVEEALEAEPTQNQFDAICSLAFNIGCKAMGGSTLIRLMNAGDTAGAASQFMRWNKAGGQVMAGLTRRRQAEHDLFVA